jgi:hypothetical protein
MYCILCVQYACFVIPVVMVILFFVKKIKAQTYLLQLGRS